MPAYIFDKDQLDRALEAYLAEGASALRAMRQQDVDSVRVFIGSDAARKLRVQPSPPATTAGLRPQMPPRPLTPAEEEDLRDG
jgi:hypothetical protein